MRCHLFTTAGVAMGALLATGQELPGDAARQAPPIPPNRAERAAMARKGWNPNGTVPSFPAAQMREQFAAGERLMADLQQAADAGEKHLVIPPGDYRYRSTGHGTHHANAPFRFVGWTDVTVEGYGATIWMTRGHGEETLHDVQSGIWIENCRNLTLKGLALDYDPPSFLQGTVTTVDLDAGAIEFEADPGMLQPTEFNSVPNLSFYDETGRLYPQPYIHRQSFEKTTDHRYRLTLDETFIRLQRDADLMARFGGKAQLRPGHYIAMPMRTGTAIDIFRCTRVTLEDIDIYQTPGFAICESQGGGGHTYRRVRIIRRPGTRRLAVSAADLFHSNLVAKGPLIEACEFSHAFDDAVNVHGRFATVLERPDERTVVLMHQYGGALEPGRRVRFMEWLEMFSQGEAVVVSVSPVPTGTPRYDRLLATRERLREERGILLLTDRFREVRFADTIDAEVGSFADLMGLHNGDGFLVRDSYFHSAAPRGALINGASNGRFENCTWRDYHGGFFVTHESWYYLEGPVPRGIQFVGNRIIDCGAPSIAGDYNAYRRDMPTSGIFMVTMEPAGRGLRRVKPLRDIAFIGNYFENLPASAIGMNYVRGGGIKGNTFRNVAFGGVQHSAINLSMVDDIVVEDNTVLDPAGGVDKLVDLGVNCRNVTLDGVPLERPEPTPGRVSLMDVARWRKSIRFRSGRTTTYPAGDNGALIRYHGLMPQPNGETDTECYAFHPPWKGETGAVTLETDLVDADRYSALLFRTCRDNPMGDGVTLTVTIQSLDDNAEAVAYSTHIAEVGSHRHSAPLAVAGTATLRITVGPGPNNDTGYDMVFVGGLELLEAVP